MNNPIGMQYDFHAVTFLLVYAAILIVLLIIHKIKRNNKYRLSFLFLFALYAEFIVKFAILPITVLFENGIGSMYDYEAPYTQFVPLNFINEYLNGLLGLKQIIGNILLLLPLSFFIRFMLESKTVTKIRRKTLLIGAGISISIELIQLMIDLITNYPNRVMDIDDVILNVIGMLLGIFLFDLLKKCKKLYNGIINNIIFRKELYSIKDDTQIN